jgi:hypothetical protein
MRTDAQCHCSFEISANTKSNESNNLCLKQWMSKIFEWKLSETLTEHKVNRRFVNLSSQQRLSWGHDYLYQGLLQEMLGK